MNDKQQSKENERQPDNSTRPQANPFKEAGQKGDEERSPEEEAEAEQQYKEALTERD